MRPLELLRGTFGDDPTVVQDGDPVGEMVGFVQVLGGEQDRDAAGGELNDVVPHPPPAAGIQAGRGFVEEDHPGGTDQRHRQVQPPPHPA